MVEQIAEEENIIWCRFGRAVEVMNGIVTSVKWSKFAQRAEFEKSEFLFACSELKQLTEKERAWSLTSDCGRKSIPTMQI